VLPILKTDFVSVCEAMVNGTLGKQKIEFDKKATVCKYAVPKGYPDNPVSEQKIIVPSERMPGTELFYAAVDQRADGLYLTKSRSIAFVGIADTIMEAEAAAEHAISSVKGPVFHRKDIGTKTLLDKRVQHMRTIGAL